MISDNSARNQKDISGDLGIVIKDRNLAVSYNKTSKLITALYMVTEIMDSNEPIRHRLRILGTGIMSDMYSTPSNALMKISEIMSFLDISCSMNIVSEMNCNILRQEFTSLGKFVRESMVGEDEPTDLDHDPDLTNFFSGMPDGYGSIRPNNSITANNSQYSENRPDRVSSNSNRIGVQKGSTLMRALSDKKFIRQTAPQKASVSRERSTSDNNTTPLNRSHFDGIKTKRRESILVAIKDMGGSATIKDIKDIIMRAPANTGLLGSSSEKTLQRELVSMVKDSVIEKMGEKRWSKYILR